ncbi:hypothetical protein DPMN_036315 [Dreissena polymorpha]|uniref:Uncharacterized protein n=1 Tax=Dreissena polymorpha TaxID=45954 RepID=A0A9D4RLT8_DREPO|nr:hypothetical protein DPMN_036315 [Dreissena polymorpha]
MCPDWAFRAWRVSAKPAGLPGPVPGERPSGLASLHCGLHHGHLPTHPSQGHHRPAL